MKTRITAHQMCFYGVKKAEFDFESSRTKNSATEKISSAFFVLEWEVEADTFMSAGVSLTHHEDRTARLCPIWEINPTAPPELTDEHLRCFL